MSFFHSQSVADDTFEPFFSDYDPSVPGDMERQIVQTNEFKSSTFICVNFHEVEEKTAFELYIQASI